MLLPHLEWVYKSKFCPTVQCGTCAEKCRMKVYNINFLCHLLCWWTSLNIYYFWERVFIIIDVSGTRYVWRGTNEIPDLAACARVSPCGCTKCANVPWFTWIHLTWPGMEISVLHITHYTDIFIRKIRIMFIIWIDGLFYFGKLVSICLQFFSGFPWNHKY